MFRKIYFIQLNIFFLAVLAFTGCAPEVTQRSTTSTPTAAIKTNQDVVGIIALGHSGLTGEGSDPDRPGQDARENSWATGTAPQVNSVYQRLIAVHPETEGHVANLAQGGAPVTALLSQAQSALKLVPHPELVIIETIDGDIRCDGSDNDNIRAFGDALARVLQTIVEASPNSHILVVSQQGRPATFAAAVASDPSIWQRFVGSGMCDLFNSDGTINQEHIEALTGIIESYEAEQSRVCAMFPQCSTDGGVFSSYVDDLADWVPDDWNHLNVSGQARRAEIIWPIIADLLN